MEQNKLYKAKREILSEECSYLDIDIPEGAQLEALEKSPAGITVGEGNIMVFYYGELQEVPYDALEPVLFEEKEVDDADNQ